MNPLKLVLLLLALWIANSVRSQDFIPHSIHREQSEQFKDWNSNENHELESVKNEGSGFISRQDYKLLTTSYELNASVFGYHPYWSGNAHLEYQWDLLSDLCYFSYEVDPATGHPITTHDFLTADAVDSAQANAVNVHLCVTLFSNHSTFFGNQDTRQTLIDELIWYVKERNAQGVNMDFEAVPYSMIDDYMLFLADFSQQFHNALPGGIVSIAMPAVDWSGEFDVAFMNDYIDLYMIMGYDYYWNGSGEAGPVAPLYSMTGDYNYNLSRTLSYYQAEGMPGEKILLGLPYYARQWPTEQPFAPSEVRSSGTAYTYAYVKNNGSGYYSEENQYWEAKSFSHYYSFESNGWNQCFLEEIFGLGKRYDLVNRRQLAGIGIWALGYDEGHTELWELIGEKFTEEAIPETTGTIYDSGGPYWDYYAEEEYSLTIGHESFYRLKLEFFEFALESGYDSLWIYDGPDTLSPLLGAFSGNELPPTINSTQSFLTLHFKSDAGVQLFGWEADYHAVLTGQEETPFETAVFVYPNPAREKVWVEIPNETEIQQIQLYELNGSVLHTATAHSGQKTEIDLSGLPAGLYLLSLKTGEKSISKKILLTH